MQTASHPSNPSALTSIFFIHFADRCLITDVHLSTFWYKQIPHFRFNQIPSYSINTDVPPHDTHRWFPFRDTRIPPFLDTQMPPFPRRTDRSYSDTSRCSLPIHADDPLSEIHGYPSFRYTQIPPFTRHRWHSFSYTQMPPFIHTMPPIPMHKDAPLPIHKDASLPIGTDVPLSDTHRWPPFQYIQIPYCWFTQTLIMPLTPSFISGRTLMAVLNWKT